LVFLITSDSKYLKKSRTKEMLVPDILGEREKIKEAEKHRFLGT
jgi:hypothetical protein